jgi:phage terminase Nu1 subunit (DNA packaging protein)
MVDLNNLEVRRDELAEFLGLSPRRINALARNGIIPKPARGRYPLRACVQAYAGTRAKQRDFDGIDRAAIAALMEGFSEDA